MIDGDEKGVRNREMSWCPNDKAAQDVSDCRFSSQGFGSKKNRKPPKRLPERLDDLSLPQLN
jgi:hypothetical protein